MEQLTKFLIDNSLVGGALLVLGGLLRYYVSKDIAETRAGVASAKQGNTEVKTLLLDEVEQLKAYVEKCELDLEKKLATYDKEIAMIKQEAGHTATDIKASIGRIEANLAEHTRKEEIYQRNITDFMGYVYRHIGNGSAPKFGQDV